MWSWEVIASFILGFLGLGVMAGQDFEFNLWVGLFWGAAAILLVVRVLHSDPRRLGRLLLPADHEERNPESPTFEGNIDAVALAQFGGLQALILLVNVGNVGVGQSILQHWRIAIQPPGGPAREIQKASFNDDDELVLTSETGAVTIKATDFLTNKTHPVPLASGVYRRGWLMAMLPEAPPPGTRFSVSCNDANRKRYVFEFDSAKGRGPLPVEQVGHWPDVSIKHGPAV